MKELDRRTRRARRARSALRPTRRCAALENDAKLAARRGRQPRARRWPSSRRRSPPATPTTCSLRALELDAKTSRDQLESYLQKYREAVAREAENAAPADARIIASASEPRAPTFPKKLPTVLLATLAGFLVSLAAAVARALLADAVVVRRRRVASA